jgi:hypothetical protein
MQTRGVRLKYYLRESVRCHVQYDTNLHTASKTAGECFALIFITYGVLTLAVESHKDCSKWGFV